MKILLVGDDVKTVKTMTAHIRALGHDVTVCGNADTACEACRHIVFPLILLDVERPELDAAAVCRRLRALPQGDQCVLWALTRSERSQTLQALFDAGIDDYVTIPAVRERLRMRFAGLARQFRNLAQRAQTEERLSKTLQDLQQADEELRVQNEELLSSNDELRQIQHNLEISRQKYADLYDFAPIGYCTLDEDGTVLEANLTAARLLGEERDRLLQARFYHFIAEDDRDRFFLHLRTLDEEHRQHTCTLRLLKADGSHFTAQLETTRSPESDRQNTRYQTAISDITARARLEEELRSYRQHLEDLVEKRTNELQHSTAHLHHETVERQHADQSLRTSEQQYRLLAENVADGIGIIQNGKLVFVNDALAAMLGYAAQQLMGTNALDLVHHAYQDAFRKRIQELAEGELAQDWQALYITRDGREVWIESHHRVIEWEGQPAVLATLRDITARKHRERAMEKERAHLRKENVQLRSAIEDRSRFGDMVGKSPAMQEVYAQIVTAAAVDANVLIAGESGTGKELAAHTIHQLSRRTTQEFVAVNCGAIPENLFEREFFGHRKGAFTGAEKDTPGLFDRAHKGTLFLDEVGELPAAMQVKLLRVLESGEYTPVGQNRPRQVDVRLIAATNKHLETLVKEGVMRDDFFYRIYVLSITMPPLRQRPEDIPLLIDHFLQQYDNANAEPLPALPADIVDTLSQHTWPGNVRELHNVLHRYLQEHRLALSDIRQATPVHRAPLAESEFSTHGLTFRETIEAYEKRLIASALHQHHNNAANAAKSLGMPLRTLYRKIEKYHIV